MKNKKLLLSLLLAFAAVTSPAVSHADGGFDSVSDTNNFKANGTTVLTLTGSSKAASFMGDASFAGSIFSTGTITAPQGVVSTRYGSSFVANAWDAVYGSIDNQTNKNYDLIGTYHGWDPDSVYIAGYNASDTNSRATAKSISFGGYGLGSSPTGFVDLLNHRIGIGNVAPASLLSVGPNSEFQVNGAGDVVVTGGSDGRFGFYHQNQSGYQEVLAVEANRDVDFMGGNVGVGTSSPQSKLDVNGSVNATSYTTSGVTSYAFGGIYNSNMDGSCRYANPLTNACSCPSGYTAYRFGEWSDANCSSANKSYSDGWRTSNCGYNQYQCVLASQTPH